MVGPIYIIALALGLAFFLGFFGKNLKTVSGFLMLAGLAFMTFVSGQWLMAFVNGSVTTQEIFTAGFKPPFSINLRMGMEEAAFTFLVNVAGLLGGTYLFKTLKKVGNASMSVFLVLIMSLNVIIMTRDLFNLFVFVEIGSIATAGLIILDKTSKSLQAGFKYMIAIGVISGLLLIGIVFAYYFAGSLNIDSIITANIGAAKAGAVAVFLIVSALILELKPFPANGWGLDVYESANPGIGAMVSAGIATASLFVLYKILPMAGADWYQYIVIVGLLTFVGSNLIGTQQKNANRLLGYSSIGQIGLVMTVIGLEPVLGESFKFIAFALLLNHFLAKAGLFWISGIIKKESIASWSVLRKNPVLLIMFIFAVFALIGFPPFPSFFGKYELIMSLVSSDNAWVVAVILIGSFAEGIYIFRWLGDVLKNENSEEEAINIEWNKLIPVALTTIALVVTGFMSVSFVEGAQIAYFIPLAFILVIGLIDFLPAYIKNTVSIAGMAYYTYILYPLIEDDLMRTIFFAIFMIGGILTLIVGYNKTGKREGFYPAALLMYAGLATIIASDSMFGFFFGWELMTAGSYFLIIRGKRSKPHAYSYMLFSVAGAYLILLGFGMAYAGAGTQALEALKDISVLPTIAYTLLAVGFMTKTASLGLHIWLPGAHGEAESDVSPMVSAVLLKAGVFGLMLLFLNMGENGNTLLFVLGWVGAFTALTGNLAATFQEDAKRMLAYSSIGQLGYILFAIAMMTQLGWLAGFTYVINHFAFKAILFMVIGGIVAKLHTHNLYEMGGLIKKMPFSFTAVMIGIITLSGVPPLSGFAGKWLFYNAVVLKGWYIQGVIVFFAGTIAFMYAFKLIHSIFLGQLKDNHRNMKEISSSILIPVYILIAGIFYFSAFPQDILEPIGNMLAGLNLAGDPVVWNEGGLATTILSHWNGTAVMIIILTTFVLVLGYLWLLTGKTKKLEQFNIVYSGEAPFRPETTHVSYNMFAGLNKAIGFLVAPGISNFWKKVSTMVLDLAGVVKRLYSGNGQVYAAQIIIYIVVFYLIALG
ncbi:MAG: proton-conducting transporter membrane subunit [Bacteroidota bacterium]